MQQARQDVAVPAAGGSRRTNSGYGPSGFRHFAGPQGKRLAESSSDNLFATKLAQRCRSTSLPFATFRSFFRFLLINIWGGKASFFITFEEREESNLFLCFSPAKSGHLGEAKQIALGFGFVKVS